MNRKERNILPLLLTIMRILVGWHFLYEGISKLALPGWSSSAYLMQSKWLFSGFFHWIIAHPDILAIADFLNIWGLILIGLGLFLGLFTRPAAIAGMFLLLVYYVANPPFMNTGIPSEANYYLVNLNLIEAGALLILAFAGRNYLWGLDRTFHAVWKDRKEKMFPAADNHEIMETGVKTRRELIKDLAAIPVLGLAFFGMAKKVGWFSFEEGNLEKPDATSSATVISARMRDIRDLRGQVPKGRIGNLEISRIIPGGNLVAGFAHARDLIYVSPLIKNYFSDEKVIETLWLYEACGINTVIFRTDEQTIRILNKFRKRGGKIQWLAQTYPKDDDLTNIKLAIDQGAAGAFVMGSIADKLVYENRLDHLARPIEYIRSQGLITGTAGHATKVPQYCVEHGIETDFFMKTFHDDRYWSALPASNRSEFMHNLDESGIERTQYHDNMWCASAADVTAFFTKCKTPWIAYKVLAAGALDPEVAFRHAFENGADFICVGMFDFQVIPNANTVYDTLSGDLKRERPWYA